jgi:hypothetical protein
MSGPDGIQSGGSSQTLIANADTSTAQTDSSQPEQGANPNAVAPGAAGGGVSQASADKTKAIESDGQKVIAAWAKLAGLGDLKSDGSHPSNVVNAGKVFVKLTQLGSKDPAMKAEIPKFLNALADAGKNVYNWGLKLEGVPLNQLKAFKGVDAAQGNSQTQGNSTSQTGTSTTEGSGKGMSPDAVRAAVMPMLQEVATADKNGDPNKISLADLEQGGKKLDPQLLGIIKQKIEQGGDMTVADAANHVAELAVASQQGKTQQAQAPQGDSDAQQQQGQLDLTKLNVKQFIADVNTTADNNITRAEMEQARGSDKIDATGKQLLEVLLSNMPAKDNLVTDPKKLESLLLSAQQQQIQGKAGADQTQGAKR